MTEYLKADRAIIKDLCLHYSLEYDKMTTATCRLQQYIFVKYAIIEILRFKGKRKTVYLADLFGYVSHDVIVKAHKKHDDWYCRDYTYTDIFNTIQSYFKINKPKFYEPF